MKNKRYFENINANICYPLNYFTEEANENNLKEITLIEAIPDFSNEDHIWCTYMGEVGEKNECNKSSCDAWTKGKGNVCDHRGKLYSHGEPIILKIK